MVHVGLGPTKKELPGPLWGDKARLVTPGTLCTATSSFKPGVVRPLCALLASPPQPLLLPGELGSLCLPLSLTQTQLPPPTGRFGTLQPHPGSFSITLLFFLRALSRCSLTSLLLPSTPVPHQPAGSSTEELGATEHGCRGRGSELGFEAQAACPPHSLQSCWQEAWKQLAPDKGNFPGFCGPWTPPTPSPELKWLLSSQSSGSPSGHKSATQRLSQDQVLVPAPKTLCPFCCVRTE